MPYATGTANNATELRTAMTNLATANGWTWDAANEMLHKTPVFGKLTISGLNLFVQSALGYVGATLTTPSDVGVGISDKLNAAGITLLNYPVTYHVFVLTNPDVIVLAVNWGTVWWQWLMFGNSTPLGDEPNPLWQFGSSTPTPWSGAAPYIRSSGLPGDHGTLNLLAAAPCFPSSGSQGGALNMQTSALFANVDGLGWGANLVGTGVTSPRLVSAGYSAGPLLSTQPNAWNGEAELVRLTPVISRPSSLWSYVCDLAHVRITRNDNYSDGQIITIGSDKWFVAPCFRKNAVNRDSSLDGDVGVFYTHSGTMALAIRYDGP